MRLLWTDIETTGLGPRTSAILEIAVYVADLSMPFDVAPLPALHRVLYHDGRDLSPFIVDMHTRNGLLAECVISPHSRSDVGAELLKIAQACITLDDEKPTLAGASVHFDLGFIRHHWPDVGALLSHRVYDTSAIGLFCESLGMPRLPRDEGHRAIDYVCASIARAKVCAAWLKERAFR